MRPLEAVLALGYPFVVYVGLQWLSPRALTAVVALVLAGRCAVHVAAGGALRLASLAGAAAIVAGTLALAAMFDDGRFFKLVPVFINLGLLGAFARTLVRGPSMVEALARMRYATLAPGGVPYCRRVTLVWAAFFAVNAIVIFWLAVAGSLAAWTLYTGLLAYLAAGALFATERVYRAWRFRHYGRGPADAILRHVFPPRVGT